MWIVHHIVKSLRTNARERMQKRFGEKKQKDWFNTDNTLNANNAVNLPYQINNFS